MAKSKNTKPSKKAAIVSALLNDRPALPSDPTALPNDRPTTESLFEMINRTAREATGMAQKAATTFTDAAKDKALSIIDGWVEILPRLETLGLENHSFGLSMGLNPSLRLELFGSAGAMTVERIDEILAENGDNNYIKLIFQAIRATVGMHNRAQANPIEPLIVQISVKLSPEITVFIGKPI